MRRALVKPPRFPMRWADVTGADLVLSHEVRGGDVSDVRSACTGAAQDSHVLRVIRLRRLRRVRCLPGCQDPALAFYPVAPRRAPSPETLFVLDPNATGCGTSFVTVARCATPHETSRSPCEAQRRFAVYARFKTAPAGGSPVVAYRHSAIISFRASATIPMRRARAPRQPNVR